MCPKREGNCKPLFFAALSKDVPGSESSDNVYCQKGPGISLRFVQEIVKLLAVIGLKGFLMGTMPTIRHVLATHHIEIVPASPFLIEDGAHLNGQAITLVCSPAYLVSA